MKKISHPHDHFFRKALSDPRVAQSLLAKYMPSSSLERVDLTTLEFMPTTFIEPHLKEIIADVLFKVNINDCSGYVYLLLEHQSTPDKLMPFRLLRYMVSIIERDLANRKDSTIEGLPAVLPMVFYNGKHKYNVSRNLLNLFNEKELMKEFFLNDFHLIDFNTIPDEQAKENAWSGLLELAMKHIHSPELLPKLEANVSLFTFLYKAGGRAIIESVLYYIVSSGKVKDEATYMGLVGTVLPPQAGDEMMSVAQIWEERGEIRGISKGEKLGKRSEKVRIAQNMLSKGLKHEVISETTGLPLTQIRKLEQNTIFA